MCGLVMMIMIMNGYINDFGIQPMRRRKPRMKVSGLLHFISHKYKEMTNRL